MPDRRFIVFSGEFNGLDAERRFVQALGYVADSFGLEAEMINPALFEPPPHAGEPVPPENPPELPGNVTLTFDIQNNLPGI